MYAPGPHCKGIGLNRKCDNAPLCFVCQPLWRINQALPICMKISWQQNTRTAALPCCEAICDITSHGNGQRRRGSTHGTGCSATPTPDHAYHGMLLPVGDPVAVDATVATDDDGIGIAVVAVTVATVPSRCCCCCHCCFVSPKSLTALPGNLRWERKGESGCALGCGKLRS